MTDLIYLKDSALREFTARVTLLDKAAHAVILDRTAFYPGGGGQPYDVGTLYQGEQAFTVKRMKRDKGQVLHVIEGDTLPSPHGEIRGVIDWDRRYELMRTHTALHILCGVVWRDYGAQVTGGNMEPLSGRMDFEFETMHADLVAEIEEKINAEVAAARDVRVAILPREEAFQIPDLIRTKINLLPEHITEVRTVEIVGLDLQADGGTHVSNTREVGKLRVTDYKSKGRINKRIYLEVED